MSDLEILLGRVHEDLVYVIECLAEDLPGEAKQEMAALASLVSESLVLDDGSRRIILGALADARKLLLMDSYDQAARQQLAGLRRRLRNTLDVVGGAAPTYAVEFAPPLPVGQGG